MNDDIKDLQSAYFFGPTEPTFGRDVIVKEYYEGDEMPPLDNINRNAIPTAMMPTTSEYKELIRIEELNRVKKELVRYYHMDSFESSPEHVSKIAALRKEHSRLIDNL